MAHAIIITTVILCAIFHTVNLIAIDNSVVDARLSCRETEIDLAVTLARPLFQAGRIYVKGKSDDSRCGVIFDPNSPNINYVMGSIGYRVPLGACGMERVAARNPVNRQLTYTMTLVVSFHPTFVTKVDRAYRLVCNYGGQPEAAVTAAFSVSMIPTEDVPLHSFDMPNCRYSIYAGDDGNINPLRFAKVGDKIRHVWKCEALQPNQRMWIHDCSVSPEYGDGNVIVNSKGCTVDPVVMGQLEYVSADTVMGTHHAYKYADHPTLLFKCTISICDVNRPESCQYMPPPDCRGGVRFVRRVNDSLNDENNMRSSTGLNVLSHPILMIDVQEEHTYDGTNSQRNVNNDLLEIGRIFHTDDQNNETKASVCFPWPIFAAILLSVLFATVILAVVMIKFLPLLRKSA